MTEKSEGAKTYDIMTIAIVLFAAMMMSAFAAAVWDMNKDFDKNVALNAETSKQVAACEANGGKVSYVKTRYFSEMLPVRNSDGNVACQEG